MERTAPTCYCGTGVLDLILFVICKALCNFVIIIIIIKVSGYRDTIQTAERLEAVKWSQVIVWKAADETKRFLNQLRLFKNVSHGFIVFDRFSRHVQQHGKKNRSSVTWFSIVTCYYVWRPSDTAAALLKRKEQTALNSSFHPKLIQNQIWTWWMWMICWRAVVFGPHVAAELLPLFRPPGAAAGGPSPAARAPDLLTQPWTWRPRSANVRRRRSHSEPNASTNQTHSDASAQDAPSGGGGADGADDPVNNSSYSGSKWYIHGPNTCRTTDNPISLSWTANVSMLTC